MPASHGMDVETPVTGRDPPSELPELPELSELPSEEPDDVEIPEGSVVVVVVAPPIVVVVVDPPGAVVVVDDPPGAVVVVVLVVVVSDAIVNVTATDWPVRSTPSVMS